ncbi:hypothetical protein M2146_001142 [Lachnospiraceae bacterium PF1-22]
MRRKANQIAEKFNSQMLIMGSIVRLSVKSIDGDSIYFRILTTPDPFIDLGFKAGNLGNSIAEMKTRLSY